MHISTRVQPIPNWSVSLRWERNAHHNRKMPALLLPTQWLTSILSTNQRQIFRKIHTYGWKQYNQLRAFSPFLTERKITRFRKLWIGTDCNIKVTPVGKPPLNKDFATKPYTYIEKYIRDINRRASTVSWWNTKRLGKYSAHMKVEVSSIISINKWI